METKNGKILDCCPIAQEVKEFVEDWTAHKAESIRAFKQVNMIHEVIIEMKEDTSHLSKLDVLTTIAGTLKDLNDNLVGPATSENKISLKAHLVTLAIMGIVIITLVLGKTEKTINLGGASGLSIQGERK